MSLLDEIAQRAGVSRMTVSNILNDRTKGATSAARKRVEQIKKIASELRYTPNASAQALSSGKTKNVGLIFADRVPEMRGIFHALLESLTNRLEEAGYHLLFVPMFNNGALSALRSQRFDGCVVVDPTTQGLTDVIAELGTPGVTINVNPDLAVSSVMPDDGTGMRLAFEHLYQLGHRRIAYFRSKNRDVTTVDVHPSVAVRLNAFAALAKEYGLEAQCSVQAVPAEEFVARHKFGRDGITAVIGYCHIEMYLLMRHLTLAGYALPRDVSIVGFNDVEPTAWLNPALTMVDVRQRELGRMGGELLLEQICDARPPRHVMIEEKLIVRESTARVPV